MDSPDNTLYKITLLIKFGLTLSKIITVVRHSFSCIIVFMSCCKGFTCGGFEVSCIVGNVYFISGIKRARLMNLQAL